MREYANAILTAGGTYAIESRLLRYKAYVLAA
jgi:hypothetical protein